MSNDIKPIKSIAEYKALKARVNKFEREMRKKNPRKHAKESKEFVSAILKNIKGKRKK